MSSSYLIPSITSLSPGYNCTIPVPWTEVGDRLIEGRGRVIWTLRTFREGGLEEERTRTIVFEKGLPAEPEIPPFTWTDAENRWDSPGYLEMGFESATSEPIFRTKTVLAFYAVYSAPEKKSFFSDNAYKYASPPVIAQIAQYGQYIDGYPVVRLDRGRDIGMTLILINPYSKQVVARIMTHDGRSLDRIKVAPMSTRHVPFIGLLREGEDSWSGQIQLTANNRLVTFISMHSLVNPLIVSDQEHLDPYRGESTHMPAFQWLRRKIGRMLANRGISWNIK